jgi:cyclic pyranopterin phosphate synthase
MISTHINESGDAHMVDVSEKLPTAREAQAQTRVYLGHELISELKKNSDTPKGNLFSVCILAGIMAAKKTSDLIPLCHPLPLSKVEVKYDITETEILFHSLVKTQWVTGVEMEALMASSIAALTCYDMLKSKNKGIIIGETKLLSKTGGKSGDFHA